ncbi:hypothetical protein RCH16_003663 [Cryobacterium sp. MP_M5]|nr:hypothetical protein [Cryobacterium sp. MP_M3]MEC5178623.1 hypothetical protein [Cryobacterium sp. MP_M5]
MIARIQHFFEESDGTYGYRRIHADLAAEQTEWGVEPHWNGQSRLGACWA